MDGVPLETYKPAAAAVYDAVRRAVPGNLARDDRWWDRRLQDEPDDRDGATARRYLLHTEPDGTVTGYAAYRMKGDWTEAAEPDGTLLVEEVRALSTPAYASLWKVLLSVDLVRTTQARMASADDPLKQMLTDPRALNLRPSDALWVRLVDVGAALSARRYPTNINLVFEVRDDVLPVERRALARVGPSRRRVLRPHRPRPRPRARHRGAVGRLPGRGLAGHPPGGRAGHRDQPRGGDARVDGVLLAGHAVVPGGVLTWQRPGRSPSTGRTSHGPAG